ncbi:hypothetical protein JCM5350_003284 [Sporobolomyces pararoseus]
MASHHYPAHPPTGGKGLPPPSNFLQPQHPPLPPQQAQQYGSSHSHIQGNPPDLEKRYKLKVRYLKIQKKYFRSLEVRKDLELELAEKEAKQQKLQDEIDLILDQIHQSDYAHLRPKDDNIFSDDEGEGEEEAENGTGDLAVKREAPEDEERDRRKQLEEEYGIDSSQATINPSSYASFSKRSRSQSQAQQNSQQTSAPSNPSTDQTQPPNPKRIKLTFGSGTSNTQFQ